MASVALNAQLVVNRQIAHLAEDDVFEQEEVYPQLVPVKVPDLKAITEERARKCFSARLQAYDIIAKTVEKWKVDTITETQQSTYFSALKRELSPFLSVSFKKPSISQNPPASPTMLSNLQQYLAKMAIESLAQILRSNLGQQLTRRSIGQVIRLLTNLIFQSESRQLVLHAIWVFSFWNFDVETVPMVGRTTEVLDRAEETTLNNQGWIPFWACTNWKEVPSSGFGESTSGFSSISVSWTAPQWSLASNLDLVLQSKTSARLVTLVDAIIFPLTNPEVHHSASIRTEALTALQRLIRLIPGPMMDLQHRWLHALYPALYDSKLAPAKQEAAMSILIEVSNHLYKQAPHHTTSHILLRCLSPPPSPSPSDKVACYNIYQHIQEGFASENPQVVLKTVSIWGPLVLLLGEGLFKENMINVMLKLMQTTFTHIDVNVRTLSFQAWSFLLLAFSHTSTGLRIWKRLKLLHLPIIRAYTQEDNFAVLHAAFDTHVQLISSVWAHMAVDWLVILAQPLQILLKNPLAQVKVNHDTMTPTTSNSSQTSGASLPHPSDHIIPYGISIIDRYCLLICRMLQNRDVSGSLSLITGFHPFEPFKLTPYVSKHDETKKDKSWNIDVVAMERQMHQLLQTRPEETKAPQTSLPSLSGTPSSQSFLSLVLSLIIHCVNSAEQSDRANGNTSHSNRVELTLARCLWESLCTNIADHLHGHSPTPSGSSNEHHTGGILISAQSILAWSVVLLCAIGSVSDNKHHWSHFLEEAIRIVTHVHASLDHGIISSHSDGSERASGGLRSGNSDATSTFAQFCLWIVGPTCLSYNTTANPTLSSPPADPPSVLRSAPFFGLIDLVSYCFEQLQQEQPPFEQKSEIWSKRSPADRVADFGQTFGSNIQLMILHFCDTLPRSNRALENVLQVLRPIPAQLQQCVYPGLQNLAGDVLASQIDLSELAAMQFRLNISFSISSRLLDVLRDSIQSTALIYPMNLYHTTSHHSSPNKKVNSATVSDPVFKAAIDASSAHVAHGTSSMEGIVEFEAGGAQIGRNQTTLPSTTFPATYSLAIGGQFLPSSGKSSGSDTSHQTTTTSSAANGVTSSGASSTLSEATVATETRHPRLLLRDVLECISHPLQLAKKLLQVLSPLFDAAHPGANSLGASLLRNVLTKPKREELTLSVHNLIQVVARICKTRSVDLALSGRSPSSQNSSNPSFTQMSIIFYLNLIQLFHQFRDITTFRHLNHLDASQSSKPQNSAGDSMTHIRIWQLQLWYDCFERVVDGLISTPASRHILPIRENLWAWKDTTASCTTDLLAHTKESSDLTAEMASKIETWKSARSRPSAVSEKLNLSIMSKEDVDSLMEMSIPDWSIVWGEKGQLKLNASASSSTSSLRSDNPMNHLDYAQFGSIPQTDDTGDERMMSGWSKICRRIVCCFGMIWRSGLLLLKYMPKNTSISAPTASSSSIGDQWTQSSESVLGIANSVLHSVLKLLEKWSYGYNLQVDLLPVICWAVASDSAAAKVSCSAHSLVLSLKKPMENVAGATLACISRCFAAIAGTDAVQHADSSTGTRATKPCLVPLSYAIQSLLNRTSGVWVVMFDSKRSVVRKLAWRTWSHSFGLVKLLTCSNPTLQQLILDAHQANPDEVALVDVKTWKSPVNSVAHSIPPSQAPQIVSHVDTSKMDVSVPCPFQGDASCPWGTKWPVEEWLGFHSPVTALSGVDLSYHLVIPSLPYSLEQTPELRPEPAMSSTKSPFQPKKASAASSPHPPASPTASPNHKVKLGFANASFTPLKTVPQPTTQKAQISSSDDPTPLLPSHTLGHPSHPTKPTTALASATTAPHIKIESTETPAICAPSEKFLGWAETLFLLSRDAPSILEDPDLTIAQLVEAQQHALQLATALSQRLSKS